MEPTSPALKPIRPCLWRPLPIWSPRQKQRRSQILLLPGPHRAYRLTPPRGGPTSPRPPERSKRLQAAFTLAELLVSVFVLVIIVFLVAQLMTSATAITRTGHKHIETDTQARTVFDRIALDFAQMLKRIDIDY